MQAIIFDMDGVLIDTENVSKAAFGQAFEAVGLSFGEEMYRKILGRSLKDIEHFLTETFNNPALASNIISQRETEFANHYRKNKVVVKEGIKEFLSFSKKRKFKLAVATSAKESIAVQLLKQAELIDCFDTLIYGSQVKKAKPDPELFLKAAEHLQVSPSQTYVIEDSESGIIAANRGGFHPVFIPEKLPTARFSKEHRFKCYPCISDFQESFE
ncbi:hydrolase [Enterococcus florum]|uniref:Hydrolase n=1 Tax=Enterococcus florum TaxID=2480627 RepID=A0A4P5P441_9ENTE|nr:HAD family phosphatase [Enterococcus florum]GCF92555.1 hydrolase [Enterococcus florum]